MSIILITSMIFIPGYGGGAVGAIGGIGGGAGG